MLIKPHPMKSQGLAGASGSPADSFSLEGYRNHSQTNVAVVKGWRSAGTRARMVCEGGLTVLLLAGDIPKVKKGDVVKAVPSWPVESLSEVGRRLQLTPGHSCNLVFNN